MQFSVSVLALVAAVNAASLPRQLGALTGAVPGLGDATGAVPGLSDVTGAVPGLGDAAGAVPNVGDATGAVPNVGDATGAVPNVGGATGAIPNVGGVTGSVTNGGSVPWPGHATNGDNHAGHPKVVHNTITTGEASAKCGNNQVLSCCGNKGEGSQGSLLGGLAQNLIGGNCDQVPINIIGANGILLDQCHPNNAACCTAENGGLLDIPCNPISA